MYIQINQLVSAQEALTRTLSLAQPVDKENVQKIQTAVQAALRGDKAIALAAANEALSRLAPLDQLGRTALTTFATSLQQ